MGIPRDTHDEKTLERYEDRAGAAPGAAADKIALECRRRVEESASANRTFRRQRRIDRAFMRSQYTPEQITDRAGERRPALELHPINDRAEQTMHDFREAKPGFRFGSASSDTDDPAASACNGLAIRDQRDSLSVANLERAVREAVLYGEGWAQWQIVDEEGTAADAMPHLFSDEGVVVDEALLSGAFDKRLQLRCASADDVYEDPFDDTPDRRDMNYLIEVQRMSMETRDALYPRARRLPLESFDNLQDDDFWNPKRAGGTKRDREVRVAHYYRRRWDVVEWVEIPLFAGRAFRRDMLTAEQRGQVAAYEDAGGRPRTFKRKSQIVELFITDGTYLLADPYVLPWGVIPYFRTVGLEFLLNDNEWTKRGWVYLLKDVTEWMSVTASDMVFKQSIAGQDSWLVDEESIRAFPEDWRDPTIPRPTRRYRSRSKILGPNGQPVQLQPPQYHTSEPAIQSAAASIGVARELAAMTTGSTDAHQRESAGQYRSGTVIDSMDRQAMTVRSPFIWYAVEVMAPRMGMIYKAMFRRVYDRPGRLMVLPAERTTDADLGWIVGQHFVRDPETGAPIPVDVPEGTKKVPDPQNPEVTHEVLWFNPPTDAIKIRPFSSSVVNATRERQYQVNMALIAAAPEIFAPVLGLNTLQAMADKYPVEDAVKAWKARYPLPPDPADTDVRTLPDKVRTLTQQLSEMQTQMQELSEKADEAQAARDIAEMKGEFDLKITELRGLLDAQKTDAVLEQKREAEILRAGTAGGKSMDTAKAQAVMAGIKDAGETQRAAMKIDADAAKGVETGDGARKNRAD